MLKGGNRRTKRKRSTIAKSQGGERREEKKQRESFGGRVNIARSGEKRKRKPYKALSLLEEKVELKAARPPIKRIKKKRRQLKRKRNLHYELQIH